MDEILQVIANSQRRDLVHIICEEGEKTIEEICEEFSTDPDSDTESIIKHTHIPHLVETGILRYEFEKEKLKPGPKFSKTCDIIEFLRHFDC